MGKFVHTVATVFAITDAIGAMVPSPLQPFFAIGSAIWSTVAALTAKKPHVAGSGSQTQFMADPSAGIPYAIGRTGIAGNIVHQGSYGGTDNPYQSFVIVWSGGGPHDSFEQFYVDKVATDFSSGNAVGNFHNFMWLDTQLGECPESSALTVPTGTLGGWDSSSKLSGDAAGLWTLKVDPKGKKYPNGVPKPLMVGKWAKIYDPRLDSTYPGGSGSHRALDEDTYEWSDNPWLHALTWALGRWENGKRVLGVGVPIGSIDVAAYVEAANIADVNAWKAGGVVYSTDDKWAVMKSMCQAGGGEPMRLGALLSCFVNTPRVSLATITADDLADGDISVTAMQPRRDRINGVISRWRSEEHDWEIISSDPVHVDDYVTEDGGERTREVEFPLVQDKDQVAQLGMYEVVNAREFGPISLPLKPYWIGYKPGDCLTIDIPETGMEGQDVIVMGRNFDPATGAVTPTMRSETTAKHAFALGQTGTAPPTPSLSSPTDVPRELLTEASKVAAIAASYTVGLSGNVTVTTDGSSAEITIPAHQRLYPTLGRTVDVDEKVFSSVPLETLEYIAYDDEALGGDDSGAGLAVDWVISTAATDGWYSPDNPYRHTITQVVTPDAAGDGGTESGSGPPGSGGWHPDTPTYIP